LIRPDRDTLLRGVFPSLSGSAKLDFVPFGPGFEDFSGDLLVALSGDRAPFATTNFPLKAPVGYKVVRLNPGTKQVSDFIFNTQGVPQHLLRRRTVALERPIDVKFGPDGALYIIDMGRVRMKNGKPVATSGTGKVLRLFGTASTTKPTTQVSP